MLKTILLTTAGTAAILFLLGMIRFALGQNSIGLGGKDVRVALDWLDGAPRPGLLTAGKDYGRRFEYGGQRRFYEFHVPTRFDAKSPAPVVFVFHGGGSYPDAVRYESRMDDVADREGFLVVYPAGTTRLRMPKDRFLTWNDGRKLRDGSPNNIDDVGYVKRVLDDLQGLASIDPNRIYLAGYSNGAQFSYRLIKEMPDRFAALAAVAGHRGADEMFPHPARGVSIMQFSGKLDRLAPIGGGSPPGKVEFVTVLKPLREVIESWVEANACPAAPASTRRVGQAQETRYGPGRDGAEVVLWLLENGGHTWPGGQVLPAVAETVGPINRDILAADEMWKFFAAHPLSAK